MPVPKALLMGEGDDGSTVEWGTPTKEFDKWDARYTFTLDPASRLDFHSSRVILARGGRVITLNGVYRNGDVYSGGVVVGAEPWLIEDDDGAPLPGDGLHEANPWTGRVWLNHPFGRHDWQWIKKAHDSVRYGSAELVCALVPVKPQMKWWHKYVLSSVTKAIEPIDFADYVAEEFGNEVPAFATTNEAKPDRGEYGADVLDFHRGRLRFVGAPSSAPFATAIVVWQK